MPIDPTQGKATYLIDTNLFSGSTDALRREVGGYFYTSEAGDIAFKNFMPLDNESKWIYSLWSYMSVDQIQIPGPVEDTIVPYYKFVCAADGDPQVVDGDKFWNALWTGGPVNGVVMGPLWVGGTFDDYYTEIYLPYPAIEKQILIDPGEVENYIQISCEYNNYLPEYQAYADSITNERLLPNIYLVNWTKNYAETADDLLLEVYNYLSLGEAVTTPWLNFDDEENLHDYLNSILPISAPATTTQAYMSQRFKNVFFNQNASERYYDETFASGSMFPYSCQISFETAPVNRFGGYMFEENYSSRLLRMLKEIFLEQTTTEIAPSMISFSKQSSYLSASSDALRDETVKDSELVTYKSVDLFDMLLYSYASIKNKYNDFIIIDGKNNETMATYDTKGVYRHINTAATVSVLDKTLKFLNEEGGFVPLDLVSLLNIQSETIPGLPDGYPHTPTATTVEKYTAKAQVLPQEKYNEVLAYRIEKKSAQNTGPQYVENPVQNFWFFNSKDLNDLNFLDTQIKYDKNYTYDVYAYVLVQGMKHRFSDLQLSRIIGTPAQATSTAVSIEEIDQQYCIEYYDPYTNETVNDLLENTVYRSGSLIISSIASEAQRIANTRISALAGKASMPPYFANFVTTVEPSIRIIEVPMFSKTLKILDNPPNRLNVIPNYTIDNSNRLSFEIHYENFYAMQYPNSVLAPDVTRKEEYLNAHDLLPTSTVDWKTISAQNTVEMYRIEKKPTSFRDFEGGFKKTYSLEIPDTDGTYTSTHFYDRVESNKKYYYLFRVSNQVQVPGYVDEILEAELINDGGYKYATFNTFFKDDLQIKHFNDTTRQVKKIIQLMPAVQQSILDTSAADFSQTALSQLENIQVGTAAELIWGKTFKLRLTSKKTGKKIDLNLTYNLDRN
tara:strand:+ start:2942 stop:5638 length:2697 start_codon:yes stop_codon:yes gene_type:complete